MAEDGANPRGVEGRRANDWCAVARSIVSLPRGYDTEVGERGLKLYGAGKSSAWDPRARCLKGPLPSGAGRGDGSAARHGHRAGDARRKLRAMSRGGTVITIAASAGPRGGPMPTGS